MLGTAFLLLAAFWFCLALTPAVRWLALRAGMVDLPDKRKDHPEPIARIGGVAVMAAYLLAFALLLTFPFETGEVVHDHLTLIWGMAPAAGVIFLIGFLDDWISLKPWQKLAGQFLGAMIACGVGVRISGIIGYPLSEFWSWTLTVLWLLLCTNAFNLIDGVDGLAAGLGLFATAAVLVAALSESNIPLALAAAPLAGALLAFLRYNFNPASIFLGDSGSLSIGFLLGCFGIIWSHKSATVFGLFAPLMALAIPLFDTGFTIVRRYLRKRPIFTADRGHVHHILLERGLTPRAAVLLLYGAAATAAVLSLLQNFFNQGYGAAITLVFCLCGAAGIHYLRFAELEVVGDMLLQGTFRRMLASRLRFRSTRRSLAVINTEADLWDAVQNYARDFGFAHVRLLVSNRLMEEQLRPLNSGPSWSVDIAVTDSISLTFTISGDPPGADLDSLELFVSTLRSELRDNSQLEGAGATDTATAAVGRS
jgi:UDP-GlcNAc:undecaprenyl-phosphate/decaprenyl-phosphate GlcNAc-1-phosphate transferase